MKPRARRAAPALLRCLLVLTAVGLGFRFLPDASFDRLAWTLRHCEARLVAMAALGMVAVMLARVGRMRTLLSQLPRSGGRVGWGEMASPVLLLHAGNMFLPARAGDGLFAVLVHRRLGYPLAAALAAQLADRVAQILSVWVMAVVAIGVARPGPLLRAPLLAFVGIGFAGVVLLVWKGGHAKPCLAVAPTVAPAQGLVPRLRAALGRLADPLRLLRARAVWGRALAWSCLADSIDLAMIGLCLKAVGSAADPGACLLVLLTINLAVALPSTPGQVGPLEAAAVLSLRAVGVGANEALAFALLYHAAQALPLALLGSLSLVPARRAGQSEDAACSRSHLASSCPVSWRANSAKWSGTSVMTPSAARLLARFGSRKPKATASMPVAVKMLR